MHFLEGFSEIVAATVGFYFLGFISIYPGFASFHH